MDERITSLQNQILKDILQVLMDLKMGGTVSPEQCKHVCHKLELLVVAYKNVPVVDKHFIGELHAVPESVRNEIAYSSQKPILIEFADKVQRYFGLILANEIPSDRQPGVPRIV